MLSGIGGDEVTGGVPTPTPELEDLLARGQVQDARASTQSLGSEQEKALVPSVL